MAVFIGADPGTNGAIAAYCDRRGLLEWSSLPVCASAGGPDAAVVKKIDAAALRVMLRQWSLRHGFAQDYVVAVIERMQPFGLADRVSQSRLLSMGYSAGLIEGVTSAFAATVLQPLPQQWKKALGLKRPKGESSAEFKARSVHAAQARFPQIGRVRADIAEAILLAVYGSGVFTEPVTHADDPLAAAA